MVTYCVGTTLRYASPEPGEESLTFTLIEDNDDRVLMESRDFPDWRIKPRQTVAKSDIIAIDCPDCGTPHSDDHECEPLHAS